MIMFFLYGGLHVVKPRHLYHHVPPPFHYNYYYYFGGFCYV